MACDPGISQAFSENAVAYGRSISPAFSVNAVACDPGISPAFSVNAVACDPRITSLREILWDPKNVRNVN